MNNQHDLLEITTFFLTGKYRLILKLKNPIQLETTNTQINNYVIKPLELVFNHYYYKLSYFDLFKRENLSICLNELIYERKKHFNSIYSLHNKLIFGAQYPRYGTTLKLITEDIFEVNDYFLITYIDKLNRITKRIIRVLGKDSYSEGFTINEEFPEKEYFFIIANCLFREGNIRHFNLEQIKEAIKIPDGAKLFE